MHSVHTEPCPTLAYRLQARPFRTSPAQALAYEALAMALTERRPVPGLVFHSDRGGPYLSLRVQQLAQRHRLIPSTSLPGRCLDNAVAESFFHTLKTELVYQHHYRTREEARLAIFEYIAAFYNRTRRHSSNGFRSPDEHKSAYAVSRVASRVL